MSKHFIGKKVGKLSLGDAFLIALVKTFEERITAPIIGNGTLMSGAIKIGSAMAVKGLVGGKISDIVGTALVVDGTEDMVNSFLGGNLTFGGNRSSGEVL
jgi:hypothetical protein